MAPPRSTSSRSLRSRTVGSPRRRGDLVAHVRLHVRHATAGGLTTANTHPFCQHARLFAHNGVIDDIPRLEAHLGAERELVGGQSDSERYFALITGEIDRHDGDVSAGIRAAVQWIVEHLPIVSINFVLITATELWALRYPETDSLFVLERPAGGGSATPRALEQTSSHGTRVRSAHARDRPVVIVASERMDDDDAWREVPSGELVHVDPSLAFTTERLFTGPPPRTYDAARVINDLGQTNRHP